MVKQDDKKAEKILQDFKQLSSFSKKWEFYLRFTLDEQLGNRN